MNYISCLEIDRLLRKEQLMTLGLVWSGMVMSNMVSHGPSNVFFQITTLWFRGLKPISGWDGMCGYLFLIVC